jgi:hypothetical protein
MKGRTPARMLAVPQGLKPAYFQSCSGVAEAMPYPKPFTR